ncbi:ATP-dependent zinc metalloprotease FtsH [Thermus caliditerrae]|uniref:ATP-dependent zinc metalloprotease FtsH n=1 Tax=Thermus caliditerrae TaxID=1330700 RepID=UPI001F186860|nr:ATP-dependent zinc metalloprotease FtsH [Thermus caliditerrae]
MPQRINPFTLVFLLLLGYLAYTAFTGPPAPTFSYTEFRELVRQGKVAEVTLEETRILGLLKEPERFPTPQGGSQVARRFAVPLPPAQVADPELLRFLEENSVRIVTKTPSLWPQLLLYVGPTLLLILFFWFFFLRAQGGAGQVMQFGQSRARLYGKEKRVSTTFKDVAGHQEAKRELMEVVDFLKNPQKYLELGAEIPKGVLLVGPPGTGKTLLARAVAGEAGVPFFSVSASEFMEMFVGVGASRVRSLFEDARKSAPSIIFIDELDSIGRKRGAGIGGGHDEREQTLNQILSEMDGFEKDTSVIVLAATNRPDILDPALLRPGRFDRQVVVGLPALEERKDILLVHMRGKPVAEDVDPLELAHLTPGFSGADLKNLVNEAALLAARDGEKHIRKEHFLRALDKIVLGLERPALKLSEEEKRAVAYHEAGHAVVGEVLPHADKTEKVSIVPRGMALGVRWSKPEERVLVSREHLMDELSVLMAGRVAEELFTGTVTTGAQDDFKRATQIAKRMVLDWGMGEHFKNIAWGSDSGPIFLGEEIAKKKDHSEETARLIDEDIRKILDEAYAKARQILMEHAPAMHRIAEELLREETIPGERVRAILKETQAVQRASEESA